MTDKRNLMTVIKRIAFTLLIILIYIMGTYIPIPFVEITARFQQLMENTPLSIMSVMSGSSFMRLSIFSIGLNPFMLVMLVMQLLMFTKLFGVDALSTRQIENLQQVILLIFTALQSVLFTFNMIPTRNLLRDIYMSLILTAGSMLVVWLCFMNVKFGVGGTMPIILTNIIASLIPTIASVIKDFSKLDHFYLWIILIVMIILISIYFWVAFIHAYYPLKIINTSLPSYEREITMPIGLNIGAMMTYMIGMAILTLPTMLQPYFPSDSLINNQYFNATVTGVMTFILFYFFTFMQIDPKEQAKSLRNSHSYIPGIRPGKPTQKYIRKLVWIVTFPGALLTSIQLVLGLYGRLFLGKYAGIAVLPMNAVMLAMFMTGMKDQVATILYPYKYDRLMKEE